MNRCDEDGGDDFNEACEINFTDSYSALIRKKGIDTVIGGKRRMLRAEARDVIMANKDNELYKKLRETRKNTEIHNSSVPIEDPFKLLGFDEKTSVQTLIEKHAPMMSTFGSYAYSCSCGSGKTVAGLYLMHYLGCRTLIISSRNAVNDQWRFIIQELYPELVIQTKDSQTINGRDVYRPASDVYIYSPHWLGPKIDTVNIKPSLIIYDEVHSLLSPKFIRVLLYPFVKVANGEWDELPYMIALSATYPKGSSKEYRYLTKVFGKVFRSESAITKIPVYVWDYYDHFTRMTDAGKIVAKDEARGMFDHMYTALSDYEAVEYFADMIDKNRKDFEKGTGDVKEEDVIDPTSTRFKGIIMSYYIKSSVYAALYVHKRWNCNVLLMRSIDESSVFLEKDKNLDFEFDYTVDLSDLAHSGVGVRCEYQDVVDKCSIIVGTFLRLKEGFSVQNITWGICTKFVWGFISRIQLLGRIRRSSKDEELNKKKRIMYVCSGTRPSTMGIPKARKPYKYLYDIKDEEYLFEKENYIRI